MQCAMLRQAADAERREAAKKKAEAKEKKLEAEERLQIAAKTNNVYFHRPFPFQLVLCARARLNPLSTYVLCTATICSSGAWCGGQVEDLKKKLQP